MKVKWIKDNEEDNIYFPRSFLQTIQSQGKRMFYFGLWKKELTVNILTDLSEGMIGLSRNLKEEVFIPDLDYEISVDEKQVNVGPVIAYLVSNRFIQKLDVIKERIENAVPVKGLLILSTVSRINVEDETMEGYYFQPGSKKEESQWKEGNFKYPASIFKRVPVPSNIDEHLYEKTNGRIFNSNFFNKWEMWEWLHPDPVIRKHLPTTKEVNRIDDLYNMLDIYPAIYLKPKEGSGGKGIIQVKYDGQFYQISSKQEKHEKVENLEGHRKIKKIMKKKSKYMIQQGVPLTHDSRNVDFRLYMQKDETQQWKCSGFIARFAVPGSVTTNMRYLDYLMEGSEALRKLFRLDEKEITELEQKIETICLRACQLLDKQGCFGDIAIDFILDQNQHLWILEMNKRYGYKSLSLIGNSEFHNKIISNPFLFAYSLAGFKAENKEASHSEKEKGKRDNIGLKEKVLKSNK
ncbi:YheC/YheD family protein [Alkalihalobacillus sp. LMS39]|uniref:YheC/YheD family endospore coat-associated protein n=1 Tax=Alkalihalobacillus sp. LMS39 TaxID=2924032 RepID=UPI001FB2DC1F|nr:YheC/YheD family protein [Alkalihalobacillus sp. LMS39]UOE95863.1 YheC/YheD family protein [Alkalihalobacillus sp. LMS39]